jgi:spore coat polysaccharide biosynthesis protein SpsF (cytidylyltransferase family)
LSRTAVIVLARMGSRRLPGKALLDLDGKTLIARVLERVALAERADLVILATSENVQDDPLVDAAENAGVMLFRGAHDDVLGRLVSCCDTHRLARIVRISGDSPFMPPDLIDLSITRHDASAADIVTNVHPRSYPPGASVELITANALKRIAVATTEPADREHATPYAYANPGAFDIENIRAETKFSDVRLTVDTEADLERARAVISDSGSSPERATLETVVARAIAYDRRQRSTAA